MMMMMAVARPCYTWSDVLPMRLLSFYLERNSDRILG